MKILFDHQIFTIQSYGGISRYFTQIILNLPNDWSYEIPVRYSDNEYLRKLSLISGHRKAYLAIDQLVPELDLTKKSILARFIRKINRVKYIESYNFNKNLTIKLLKKQDFDVFHPTYYDDYFLDFLGNKPFVLTIHDMIHELYPEMFNDQRITAKKAILAKKANHIIAVSENTKKDIVEILGIPDRKITVIHHATEFKNKDCICDFQTPEKYFLYVGERLNYKNFMFFVYAIRSMLKQNPSLNVICTGDVFNNNEIQFFKDLDVYDRFRSIKVTDEELMQLYKKAVALILPSYYEGFGIPILEAFAMGCPVVLSNTSSYPEVAGDAAIYFNPKNVKSIENSLRIAINNDGIRDSLKEKGLKRLSHFSWKESAIKTAEVYTNVVNQK